jgi:hypothetical protein
LDAALHAASLDNANVLPALAQHEPGGVLERVSAAAIARSWRMGAALAYSSIFQVLEKLPEEMLSEIPPDEVAELWLCLTHRSDRAAAHMPPLTGIPPRLRSALTPEEVAGGWRHIERLFPGHIGGGLYGIPVELRSAITPGEIREALRASGRAWGANALREPIDLELDPTVFQDPRVYVWQGVAEQRTGEALDWLRKQKAVARELIPLSLVKHAWMQLLGTDPSRALEWRQRVPRQYRFVLSEQDITGLLQSPDAEVRLNVIALLGSERHALRTTGHTHQGSPPSRARFSRAQPGSI